MDRARSFIMMGPSSKVVLRSEKEKAKDSLLIIIIGLLKGSG